MVGFVCSPASRRAVQGVVKVHDHLRWTDLETGYFLQSPEDAEWAKAG